MNPYSIHQALLAKHGQHVVLIHFPIGLFMAGVAFDFGAYWTGRRALSVTAYYNFLVAALSTPLVVATGLIAWQFQISRGKNSREYCCNISCSALPRAWRSVSSGTRTSDFVVRRSKHCPHIVCLSNVWLPCSSRAHGTLRRISKRGEHSKLDHHL